MKLKPCVQFVGNPAQPQNLDARSLRLYFLCMCRDEAQCRVGVFAQCGQNVCAGQRPDLRYGSSNRIAMIGRREQRCLCECAAPGGHVQRQRCSVLQWPFQRNFSGPNKKHRPDRIIPAKKNVAPFKRSCRSVIEYVLPAIHDRNHTGGQSGTLVCS